MGLWAAYNARLVTNPLSTKVGTSLTGFVLGDLIAQSPDMLDGKPWDSTRTGKMALFGACVHGPFGHYWYTWIDRTVMAATPTAPKAVITKTVLDQVVVGPFFNAFFLGSMRVLDGHPEEIADEIKEKLWPTLLVNWSVWPLAHLINFRFVPSNLRVLYINSVQIGYNTFLSTMASAKRGGDEKKGLAIASQ